MELLMHSIQTLEKYFRKYLRNFDSLSQENFINVDLKVLKDFGLLHFHETIKFDFGLTRYFQVVETPDKITLVNEEYIVWIVPENIDGKNVTYTIIALNGPHEPELELVFALTGVYNTSHLVLCVLEKMLLEIQENEELIKKIN
jgi:hypothetical protein